MLVDGPLVFNLRKASRGERPFDFHRGAPLRFGVLPRHGTAADAVWVARKLLQAIFQNVMASPLTALGSGLGGLTGYGLCAPTTTATPASESIAL